MKYSKVFIDAVSYELAPDIVTTEEIEERLKPFYDATGFKPGQLEAITGIKERRYWKPGTTLASGASAAARKAVDSAGVDPSQIDCVIYCGVGRDGFEPATACSVAAELDVSPDAQIFDVANACLGVVTGMVQAANAIELGHIRAALVVSCETAREIVDTTIREINSEKSIDFFKQTVATMTGGAGAAAVLMSDGTICRDANGNSTSGGHRLIGGVVKQASRFNDLCRWTFRTPGMPTDSGIRMRTDAHGVLQNGLVLAKSTYDEFKKRKIFNNGTPDKFICHQVGSTHQQMVQKNLGIDPSRDFSTYQYLGNIGTVSLPLTAAIADECGFIVKGDNVGFMGIGSGLNCLILGLVW